MMGVFSRSRCRDHLRRNGRFFLTVGVASLAVSGILRWTASGTPAGDFAEGFFVGISIVTNLAAAWAAGRCHRKD